MSSRSSSRRSAKSDGADRIQVGRVGTAHGLRGEVTVEVTSDNPRRFETGSELGWWHGETSPRRLRVRGTRRQGRKFVVAFEGIDDRDGALALRGGSLEVARPESPEPPEGHYYYYQLIGCRCREREAGELGAVEEVLEDGGGVILRIVGEAGEVLVPFVDPFLRRIDVDERIIELEVPPGLLEACGSR